MVCPRQTRPVLAWQPDLPGLAYALGPRILIVANPFGLIFFVLNKYCLITFWLSFEKKSSMSFLLIFNGVHGQCPRTQERTDRRAFGSRFLPR